MAATAPSATNDDPLSAAAGVGRGGASVLVGAREPGVNVETLLDVLVALHTELSSAQLRQEKSIQQFVRKYVCGPRLDTLPPLPAPPRRRAFHCSFV